MTLTIKSGARLQSDLAMAAMLISVHDTFKEFGCKCTITAGIDGSHSNGSLHYVGLAVDLRSREVPADERERLRARLAENLPDFDVVLESDHYHVEYQPKKAIGVTA